jgi:hypothetical protein
MTTKEHVAVHVHLYECTCDDSDSRISTLEKAIDFNGLHVLQ